MSRPFLRRFISLSLLVALGFVILIGVVADRSIGAFQQEARLDRETGAALADVDRVAALVGGVDPVPKSTTGALEQSKLRFDTLRQLAPVAMAMLDSAFAAHDQVERRDIHELELLDGERLWPARRAYAIPAHAALDDSIQAIAADVERDVRQELASRDAEVVAGGWWAERMIYGAGILAVVLSAGLVVVARRELDRRTRAEEAAEALATIVRQAPDAVVGMDGNGHVTSWNPAAERLFGYPAAEALGQPRGAFVPANRQDESEALTRRVLGGEAIVDFETQRLRRDGRPVSVDLSMTPLFDGNDRVVGMAAIARDVESRVRAREELERAHALAQRAAQMKSSFLANMSHEIRTPMNGVLGMTEVLLDGQLSTEQRRAAELIRDSGEALLTILNDILDLSKIEAGRLEFELVPFDLPALAASAVRLHSVRAAERSIELICDVAENVPGQVTGDPARLRQVLNNLLGNALKFTAAGEVELRVQAADDDFVVFSIRDTGIGIAPDKQAEIFDEFSQADTSTARRYGGTGLGLAISKRLVEMGGGEIRLESTPGVGSTFSFSFRLPAVSGAGAPLLSVPGAGRALVVDDNATNRRMLASALTSAGFHVSQAANAQEARACAADQPPVALAVIDADLAGDDGFRLAAELPTSAGATSIRRIMLTSASRPGDGERSRELGLEAYVQKPVLRHELLEAVRHALAGTAAAAPDRSRGIDTSDHPRRVLLAEDNPVNQRVARTLLERRGHVVDVVANGRDAVMRALTVPYDVVLMDVQMPELDGLDATREIRRHRSAAVLPIVALTAHALPAERVRCEEAGMTGFLVKPFKPDALFSMVESGRVPPGRSMRGSGDS